MLKIRELGHIYTKIHLLYDKSWPFSRAWTLNLLERVL